MSEISKIVKNFGAIKNAYNSILSEGVIEKNATKKNIFKDYVKKLNENEILKTQFLVYTNIENKVESDVAKATHFVNENIGLFSKFDKKKIIEANKSLINENNLSMVENVELYENISTLIFTEKSPKTIDAIVEATSKVVNHIVNNKQTEIVEAIDLPTSMVSTMMVEKYNEKYSELNEDERKMLKVLIESTEEEKKNLVSSTIRECIDLINENLNTDDLNVKDKLLRVKDKLLNDNNEIGEDYLKKIIKLNELKESLK